MIKVPERDSDWRSPEFFWPAPAKLNLFLHITGRRADGYHLLQTLFQFVDFCDGLRFSPRDDAKVLRSSELSGVDPEDDLTVRAARLLQRELGRPVGVEISVDKKLPMGGGLGGGSSDAATTLVALNHLWQGGLSVAELAALGLQLGADVPIFVHGHAAWAEGVGEEISPVEVPEPYYVILVPDVHVNTGQIFSHPQLTRDQHPIKIRDFLDGKAVNVFQPLVAALYPPVAEALDWLGHYAPARLTGSGGCVFAPFADKISAEKAVANLPQQFCGILCQGLNISPLKHISDQIASENK